MKVDLTFKKAVSGASEPVRQVRHLPEQYFREPYIELISISTLQIILACLCTHGNYF